MLTFLVIVSILGFFVTAVASVVMAVKRNPIWKKCLIGVGASFVILVASASAIPTSPVKPGNVSTPQQQQTTAPSSSQVQQALPQQNAAPTPQQVTPQQPTQQQTETKATTPTQQTTTPPAVTSTPSSQTQNKEVTVYVTDTGEKYHSAGCRYLSKSQIPISLSAAKASYGPCSVCNPPR